MRGLLGDGWDRPGRSESTNRLSQILVQTPLESLQAAPLGLGQILGKSERAQLGQELTEALQPPFQFGGARRQDGRRLGGHRTARIAQDLSAIPLIRNPIGSHQKYGVRRAQPVLQRRFQHSVLLFRRQRRQRVRRRRGETPSCHFLLSPQR